MLRTPFFAVAVLVLAAGNAQCVAAAAGGEAPCVLPPTFSEVQSVSSGANQAFAAAALSGTVVSRSCTSADLPWATGATVRVLVPANTTLLLSGTGCGTLVNTLVHLQCGENATVFLVGWDMRGGMVAVEPAPNGDALRNVTVGVMLSYIAADLGPAVGVSLDMISDVINLKVMRAIAIHGLRLFASDSVISSTGSATANVLSVVLSSTSTTSSSPAVVSAAASLTMSVVGFLTELWNVTATARVSMQGAAANTVAAAVVGGIACAPPEGSLPALQLVKINMNDTSMRIIGGATVIDTVGTPTGGVAAQAAAGIAVAVARSSISLTVNGSTHLLSSAQIASTQQIVAKSAAVAVCGVSSSAMSAVTTMTSSSRMYAAASSVAATMASQSSSSLAVCGLSSSSADLGVSTTLTNSTLYISNSSISATSFSMNSPHASSSVSVGGLSSSSAFGNPVAVTASDSVMYTSNSTLNAASTSSSTDVSADPSSSLSYSSSSIAVIGISSSSPYDTLNVKVNAVSHYISDAIVNATSAASAATYFSRSSSSVAICGVSSSAAYDAVTVKVTDSTLYLNGAAVTALTPSLSSTTALDSTSLVSASLAVCGVSSASASSPVTVTTSSVTVFTSNSTVNSSSSITSAALPSDSSSKAALSIAFCGVSSSGPSDITTMIDKTSLRTIASGINISAWFSSRSSLTSASASASSVAVCAVAGASSGASSTLRLTLNALVAYLDSTITTSTSLCGGRPTAVAAAATCGVAVSAVSSKAVILISSNGVAVAVGSALSSVVSTSGSTAVKSAASAAAAGVALPLGAASGPYLVSYASDVSIDIRRDSLSGSMACNAGGPGDTGVAVCGGGPAIYLPAIVPSPPVIDGPTAPTPIDLDHCIVAPSPLALRKHSTNSTSRSQSRTPSVPSTASSTRHDNRTARTVSHEKATVAEDSPTPRTPPPPPASTAPQPRPVSTRTHHALASPSASSTTAFTASFTPSPRVGAKSRTLAARVVRIAITKPVFGSVVGSPVVVSAVSVTAHASAAAATLIQPTTTATTQASIAALFVASACTALGGGQPFQEPPTVALLPWTGSVEWLCNNTSANEVPASASTAARTVATMGLFAVVGIACVVVSIIQRQPRLSIEGSRPTTVTMAVSLHMLCTAYLGPSLVGAGVQLARFDYSSDDAVAHACTSTMVAVGSAVAIAVLGQLAVMVVICFWWGRKNRQPPRDAASVGPSPLDNPPSLFGTLGGLVWRDYYDGARDGGSRWILWVFTFEDLLVAHVLSMAANTFPTTAAGCIGVSTAMLLASLAHLAYLVLLRPYEDLAEQRLATVNAALTVVVGVVCEAAVMSTPTPSDEMLATLGWLQLASNGYFFVQLLVLGALSLIRWSRNGKAESANTAPSQQPLLANVPTVSPQSLGDGGTSVAIAISSDQTASIRVGIDTAVVTNPLQHTTSHR